MEPTFDLPIEFGRYRLLKQLGVGGMGAVYLAHDSQLDRQVALKLPHFGKTNVSQIERFRREARLSANLDHPNICQVYDIGEQQGRLFLTMAYIQGNTLHETIRAKRAVAPRIAVNLVRGIASAVHFAHGQGIIHRDLKPANIMIKKNQQFVIMDFGLARRIEQNDVQVTVNGAVLGTPVYMAPEQLRGENDAVGPHSDVYSLGIILYELLVGERPFQGTLPQIYSQVLTAESVAPGFEHRIEPGLCAICRKATHSDVSRRYKSAAEFATELGTYLSRSTGADTSNSNVSSIPVAPELEATPENSRSSKSVGAKPVAVAESVRIPAPPQWRPRKKPGIQVLLGLNAVGLVLIVLVGASVLRLKFKPDNPPWDFSRLLSPLNPHEEVSSSKAPPIASADPTVSTPTEEVNTPSAFEQVSVTASVSNVRSNGAPLGGTRIYFDLTNRSDKLLSLVEVDINFVDTVNNEVLAHGPLATKLVPPLEPGKTQTVMLRAPNNSPLNTGLPSTCVGRGVVIHTE